MINKRHVIFYILVISGFALGIYCMLELGSHQKRDISRQEASAVATPEAPAEKAEVRGITEVLSENLRDSLGILLLQLVVIIASARAVGKLFLKIGQPAVVGEMLAGILLGPSVMGLLSPNVFSFVFPPSSLGTLKLLSQIGVIVFMFLVGMDLDLDRLREKQHAALIVSHVSIVVPFFLGVTLSLVFYRLFAPVDISFRAFALFVGIAMSVTAFPVLARIIDERRMGRTHLGSMALACAAVDDLSAWCILAVVIAVVKANGIGAALLTIVLALLFAAVMILAVKPGLNRRSRGGSHFREPDASMVGSVLVFVFAAALFTETIGIHALFGAFVAGTVVTTADGFRAFVREKLQAFCSVVLLPVFFAFTGLRTQISLLNDWRSWGACAAIIVVAIIGKLGGGAIAARWAGLSWRDGFLIGALMNTRGLMELIVLNIGYDLGILSARVFSMMVVMALVTTAMTGPLLSAARLQNDQRVLRTRDIAEASQIQI